MEGMPLRGAKVIPAPKAYIKAVGVKKLANGFRNVRLSPSQSKLLSGLFFVAKTV